MPPDATVTKARILDAGVREFARYGLAGARVDRIAESAPANKRSIYAHYGNKEELFDLVVAHALTEMAEAVPFTASDLADYAGRLYDYLLTHEHVLRLCTWSQLERPEAGAEEIEAYRPKVAAIEQAQKARAVSTSADPVDVLALTLAMATAWTTASPALRTLAPEPADSRERLERHRAALVQAVKAATRP